MGRAFTNKYDKSELKDSVDKRKLYDFPDSVRRGEDEAAEVRRRRGGGIRDAALEVPLSQDHFQHRSSGKMI